MMEIWVNGKPVVTEADLAAWDRAIEAETDADRPAWDGEAFVADMIQDTLQQAHDEWWHETQYPDDVLLGEPEAEKYKWLPKAA